MKICIVAGARPNFVKIAPLSRAINRTRQEGKNISCRIIYTGPQDDDSLDATLFADLDMQKPDNYLGVGYENLSERAGGIMFEFTKELEQHPANVVMVVDDLTSTMACAIVAKKRGLKVAHLVAGTRSFDMNMPKEVNRMITDGLSDYLFTAGMIANRNLNQAGTESNNVYLVGNILIDSLRYNRNRLLRPTCFSILKLQEQGYILFTVNRHVLIDNAENFTNILQKLIEGADGLPIIAPIHSYVRKRIAELGISAPNLHILQPQSYLSFGYLEAKAKAIVTDSGNVAEEATFLGIPCMTLNSYAEHLETVRIGTNELIGENPEKLSEALQTLHEGNWKKGTLPERWDGRTADRIVQTLLEL